MNRTFSKLSVLALCGVALFGAGCRGQQSGEFDLASQRAEKQDVNPVPGHKVDHGGIIINPTPHKMSIARMPGADISAGVKVDDRQGKFAADLTMVKTADTGVPLVIDFGAAQAQAAGVKALSGAYTLTVSTDDIKITGYDERGAFYGLQTLRQLVESPAAASGKLPAVEINDYPDLPNRGVVEGFYGTPWSHAVRISLINFYGRFKLNTYLYGPKDDPYHSCPNWRLPYPAREAQNIVDLVEACRRNRVDFVWAIHPGQDIKWNDEDYQNLLKKFGWMYDLGVRHFALFFDDISGEGTNPLKQTELLNNLTRDFVDAKGDVSALTVCPTDYSKLWANPTEEGSLAIYGRTLQPDVKVFWTGDVVCSDMTRETLEWVNSRIQRPAYYWWNYPVTDYVRHIIMQGPVYGLDTTLSAAETCGLISNPMEHGEASKLALYSVADYAWNIAGYNAIDSWERGLEVMVPEAPEAYRTFAIHSADTENGYRRDESWETETFRIADWSDKAAEALETEFDRVAKAPATLREKSGNKMLISELDPWLTEFEKLGERGRKAIELARIYRSGRDDARFWELYTDNTMSEADRAAYAAHRAGTMKLQPFYDNAMDDMAHGFLKKISGRTPKDYKGIGSFPTARTNQTKAMFDGDTTTYFTSGMSQTDGSWIGVDLRDVRDVNKVSIRQGRNSVDDVDYMDHAIVEYSADGATWTPLTGELTQQYIIDWSGDPVKARYVRLRRLESERKNYAAIRTFEVNPLRVDNLGISLTAAEPDKALAAFDSNLATVYRLDGTVTFGIADGAKGYILLLGPLAAPVKLSQIDASGTVVARSELSTPYTTVEPVEGAVQIGLDGTADLYEVVVRK